MQTEQLTEPTADTLWEMYQNTLQKQPKLRIRDAADVLGVSEAELVALGCGGNTVRLNRDWVGILTEVRKLGRVMVLTRNGVVVSEITGEYGEVETQGLVGQVVGEPIDLRLFFRNWSIGFAVHNEVHGKLQRSLQFFDDTGTAVHKIYLRDHTEDIFSGIVQRFRSSDQQRVQRVAKHKASDCVSPLVDRELFLRAWSELQDTHEFHGLLKKFQVSRIDAVSVAQGEFTVQRTISALVETLHKCAQQSLEVMFFVNSSGVVQIRTGAIHNVKLMEGWTNVLDPGFSLHVDDGKIGSVWRVKKPSKYGVITSLEVFDKQGELVLLLFGKRKGEQTENAQWRALVESV